MSTINSFFGSSGYNPTIYDFNAGFAIDRGDDALTARDIGAIGNTYSRTISPITSYGPYFSSNGQLLSQNATPQEMQVVTPRSFQTVRSNDPAGLVRLRTLPYPFFQDVPDMGRNPNAMAVLSATTQFQADLATVGPYAIPGYPVFNFGSSSEALDFQGGTQSFINSFVPYHPGANGQGALYPGAQGGGFYYPTPPIHPPYNYSPYQPTGHPQFIPVPGGSGYSNQPAARVSSTSIDNGYPYAYTAYPGARSTYFPGQYPSAFLGGSATVSAQGGKYKQGKANNPFAQSSFLKQASLASSNGGSTGVVKTNSNGKLKGTSNADYITGNANQSNIIDGLGGEDVIFTGSGNDVVNAHQGDRVFTGDGNDTIYYNFAQRTLNTTYDTAIDGGSGLDTMVITVGGDPTKDKNVPLFTRLANGAIMIEMNGQRVYARNIERFVIADKEGNIGSTFDAIS